MKSPLVLFASLVLSIPLPAQDVGSSPAEQTPSSPAQSGTMNPNGTTTVVTGTTTQHHRKHAAHVITSPTPAQ